MDRENYFKLKLRFKKFSEDRNNEKAEFSHYCEYFKMFFPANGCLKRRIHSKVGSYCHSACNGSWFRPATREELAERQARIKLMERTIVSEKRAA